MILYVRSNLLSNSTSDACDSSTSAFIPCLNKTGYVYRLPKGTVMHFLDMEGTVAEHIGRELGYLVII